MATENKGDPYILNSEPALGRQQSAPELTFERTSVFRRARTIEYQGNHFDIGPHRFFTRNEEVKQLFQGLLGNEAVRVARLTRAMPRRGCMQGAIRFGRPLGDARNHRSSEARLEISASMTANDPRRT